MSSDLVNVNFQSKKSRRKAKRSKGDPALADQLLQAHGKSSRAGGYKTLTTMLPAKLHLWLRYVAETTYGYTMSRIVREALEEKLAAMASAKDASSS